MSKMSTEEEEAVQAELEALQREALVRLIIPWDKNPPDPSLLCRRPRREWKTGWTSRKCRRKNLSNGCQSRVCGTTRLFVHD
jgi:hypothetical protein